MKKTFINVLLLFCISIFADSLIAQTVNSVYSMFGVGQTIDNSVGINRSLGGTGIAFKSGRSINYLNPASYLGILPNSILMEIGAYGVYNVSENTNSSQTDGFANAGYFSASLYCKNWWVLNFGLLPFSNVDYEITSSDEIEGELMSYDKNFKGTGGLNRVNMGNSFRLYKGLTVGFNASYIFGLLTQTETAATNDDFPGYELLNERQAGCFYMDYGLQYSLNKNKWLYTIGLIYGSSKNINTTDALDFTYEGTVSSLEQDNQFDLKIPQKYGIGLSMQKGETFKAGFDYEINNWSNIYSSHSNFEINNSHRFSIGMEYLPSQKKSKGWIRNLYYRLGAKYKNSYLEIDNTSINYMGLNVGVGIPVNGLNIMNISVEYGKEGTCSNGLIKNSYLGVYLNFSLYQIWADRF